MILEQKAFLKGYQRFEIMDDGNIDITFKRFSIHRQFKIPLWNVVSPPERIKTRPLGAIIGTFIFGLIILILLVNIIFAHDAVAISILLWIAFFIGASFTACLWKLKTETVDGITFHFRSGGQMHIWSDLPDANTFKQFCNALEKVATENYQTYIQNSRPITLTSEFLELKKLKDSGALSESEFEKAKAKLLEDGSIRKIGFY